MISKAKRQQGDEDQSKYVYIYILYYILYIIYYILYIIYHISYIIYYILYIIYYILYIIYIYVYRYVNKPNPYEGLGLFFHKLLVFSF